MERVLFHCQLRLLLFQHQLKTQHYQLIPKHQMEGQDLESELFAQELELSLSELKRMFQIATDLMNGNMQLFSNFLANTTAFVQRNVQAKNRMNVQYSYERHSKIDIC